MKEEYTSASYKESDILNHSTDEESISFIESESETKDEIEYIEEYKLRNKIFDFISSNTILFPVIISVLFILSYLTSKFPNTFFINELNPSKFLFGLATILSAICSLKYLIDIITLSYLKKTKGNSSYCFYINELSLHISIIISISLMCILFKIWNIGDLIIFQMFEMTVTLFYTIKLIALAILILGLLKTAVKYVSMRFNYNTYIESIRKCILFDYFVTTISNINEDDVENIKTEHIIKIPANESTYTPFDENGMPFILQKRFRISDPTQLTFAEKRLLIKEFQELSPKIYTGHLPAIIGKIKDRAQNRAYKIARRLKRQNRIRKVGNLERFFINKAIFKYLLEQLKLETEQPIERNSIAEIIEKTYKDRYVIRKSLEEINSAIQRVYSVSKWSICVFSLIFLITSIQIDLLSGLLSAIFGTQFISKILSDNVMQPLIFLFGIHPFDIGDRVSIRLDGIEENLVVGKLNVFSTIFYRFDGTSVFVPNSVLVNTSITNIRRSGRIMESHLIHVEARTEEEKIERLKMMLVEFCKNNPEKYTDYILINYEKIEDGNKLFLKVLMQYQRSQQNYEEYLENKSQFVRELNRSLIELKIKYEPLKQKVKITTNKQ